VCAPECLATSKQLKVFNLNADMFVKLPNNSEKELVSGAKKGATA